MKSDREKAENRRYVSPRRQQQADETRRRVADAARRLIGKIGYADTTIAGIAHEAGVATQTVYAIFRSKQGILKALIDRAIYGLDYEKLVLRTLAQSNPGNRLRHAAKIAREIHETERIELDFLRKAGVKNPDVVAIDKEREGHRYAAQSVLIDSLETARALRRGLKRLRAHQILWALTGRDIFRMLVIEQKWSATQYQEWLGTLLVRELLGS
jgi:AcrR family transcriptional regulator